jgi:Ca2+-dependent lipid-binding protein
LYRYASAVGLAPRHVHVCVIAGKHLIAADANGQSDPFVYVSLDNSAASEVQRTEVVTRTLNPVWGDGAVGAVQPE